MTTLTTAMLRRAATPETLPRSVEYCRTLVRSRGSSFYHGMRLVPEPARTDTYVLYSWLRRADDLADEPANGDAATRARLLRGFWERTCRVFAGLSDSDATFDVRRADPLWPAFADLIARRRLPIAPFRDSIRGQFLDLTKSTYATADELRDYCRKVASTVGLLCIEIWGYDNSDRARSLATELGVAFQLTNILRDIREDAAAGRVYVPAEYTGGALDADDILRGHATDRLLAAVAAMCADARDAYERAARLDSLVHPSARACLWAMTERYRHILRQIELNPESVLSGRRIGLGTAGKLWLLLRARIR